MSLILIIHNDGTGTNEAANYEVEVWINEKIIETLRVTEHNRRLGWAWLVQRVALAALVVTRPNSIAKHTHACGKEGSLGETKRRLDRARATKKEKSPKEKRS